MQYYSATSLREYATQLLVQLGLPPGDAQLVASALVQADLEGVETHGLGRLPNYVARIRHGLVNPRPHLRFVRQVGATALLDADNAMGQVAASHAMDEALRLASTFGVGVVGVRQSSHFGAASFYVQRAAAAGMIGVALSNTPPGMAPTGGRAAALGTNPLGIAVPAGDTTPIVIDMATSAAARGQVLKAQRDGQRIPPGWAINAAGQPTDDPAAALKGALLPLGGAKGYGLALAIELLCGALTGAAMAGEIPSFFDDWQSPSNVGHLLMALNIAAWGEPATFAARTTALGVQLKAVPPASDGVGVRLPGERRAALAAERVAQGVPLAATTVQQLNALAAELGVAGVGSAMESSG